METLVREGMDVARFNFSHGTHPEQKERLDKLKEIRKRQGKYVAALLDTKGPEIRIKTFAEGKIDLEEGQVLYPDFLMISKVRGKRCPLLMKISVRT